MIRTQCNKIYKGLIFHIDAETGYYVTNDGRVLHRYAYEQIKGEIPEGYDVRCKDGDYSNTSSLNLELFKLEVAESEPAAVEESKVSAHTSNITDDVRAKAVEWHKSEEGRKWHSEQAQKLHESGTFESELICTQCGKSYKGKKNGEHNFCSGACKAKYRRANNLDLVEVTCPVCNKTYMTNKFRPAKTCSRSCTNRIRYNK